MACNILLLASKFCFLTSQGLVGAGMNCRALSLTIKHRLFARKERLAKRNKVTLISL